MSDRDARIRYIFQASGHQETVKAFQSIEHAAQRAALAAKGVGNIRPPRGLGPGAGAGSGVPRVGLAGRGTSPEAQAAREARAAERAATQKAKAAERAAKAEERAAQRSAKAQEKASLRATKAAERAAQAQTRAAARNAAAELRVYEAREKAKNKAHHRFLTMRNRDDRNAAKSRMRAEEAARREATRRTSGAGGGRMGLVTGAKLASGAMMAMGAMDLAGKGQQAAKETLDIKDAARRLAISARDAGGAMVDPDKLEREAYSVSNSVKGIKTEDVIAGMQEYVTRTGDLKGARTGAKTFAVAASASGANVEDIAATAASLKSTFGIESEKDMQEALAAISFGGKAGAFELKDAAAKYAQMSSAAGRFGFGKGVGGVRELQGLSQIAMQATGNRDQAASAMEATLRELVGDSGKLEKQGVQVFNKDGSTRKASEVLADSVAKVGGTDMKQKRKDLQAIFGEEGVRMLSPLVTAFEAELRNPEHQTAKDRERAATEAVTKALNKAIDAPGNWAEVVKDSAEAQKQSSATLGGAWETLKSNISTGVTPALTGLVAALGKVVGAGSVGEGLDEAGKGIVGFMGSGADTRTAMQKTQQMLAKNRPEIMRKAEEKRAAEVKADKDKIEAGLGGPLPVGRSVGTGKGSGPFGISEGLPDWMGNNADAAEIAANPKMLTNEQFQEEFNRLNKPGDEATAGGEVLLTRTGGIVSSNVDQGKMTKEQRELVRQQQLAMENAGVNHLPMDKFDESVNNAAASAKKLAEEIGKFNTGVTSLGKLIGMMKPGHINPPNPTG